MALFKSCISAIFARFYIFLFPNYKIMIYKKFSISTFFWLFVWVVAGYGCKDKELPMKMNEPRNIRGVVSYKRTFNDLNKLHLNAAQRIGIGSVASRKEAEDMKKKLIHITDNEFFTVDSLTHSIPYLVPHASELLGNIGKNFLDSLTSKGLNPNRIIVTSVLRTQDDVKKLRKRNINASGNSAHCYGTTFDISWKRFRKVEDKNGRPMEDVGSDTLKLVLAEVLRDMRKEKRCYIKYELKQGCFHITAR